MSSLKRKFYFFFIFIMILLVSACGNQTSNTKTQNEAKEVIVINQFNQELGDYELFKEITKNDEVTHFEQLLQKTTWEEVDMMIAMMAPYQIYIDSKESKETNIVTFRLFVNGNQVELYTDNNKRAILSEDDADWLYNQVKK